MVWKPICCVIWHSIKPLLHSVISVPTYPNYVWGFARVMCEVNTVTQCTTEVKTVSVVNIVNMLKVNWMIWLKILLVRCTYIVSCIILTFQYFVLFLYEIYIQCQRPVVMSKVTAEWATVLILFSDRLSFTMQLYSNMGYCDVSFLIIWLWTVSAFLLFVEFMYGAVSLF